MSINYSDQNEAELIIYFLLHSFIFNLIYTFTKSTSAEFSSNFTLCPIQHLTIIYEIVTNFFNTF